MNVMKILSCLLTHNIFDLCLAQMEIFFSKNFDILILDGLNLQEIPNFEGFMQDWSVAKISELIKEKGKLKNGH